MHFHDFRWNACAEHKWDPVDFIQIPHILIYSEGVGVPCILMTFHKMYVLRITGCPVIFGFARLALVIRAQLGDFCGSGDFFCGAHCWRGGACP